LLLIYSITSVQVKQDGLKLNGTHEILVYADGRKRIYCKENTEDLLVASKQTGLEVSADKSKYMVMSRDQNAG